MYIFKYWKYEYIGGIDFVYFFIGGYDKIFYMDRVSVECYDSSIDDWTFVIEMEKVRFGFLLIVIDYNIYMIGGRYKIVD